MSELNRLQSVVCVERVEMAAGNGQQEMIIILVNLDFHWKHNNEKLYLFQI